jgi:TolB protein
LNQGRIRFANRGGRSDARAVRSPRPETPARAAPAGTRAPAIAVVIASLLTVVASVTGSGLGLIGRPASAQDAPPAPSIQDHEIPPITDGQISKIPVLVRDFRYEGAERRLLTTGESCEEILVQDLTFSDYLAVHRDNPRLAGGHADAEAIVYAEVVTRFGKVIMQGKLVDASTGNIAYEEDYPLGEPPDRWAIHAFSDDIVLYLTGERGVAQSRIAFVGDATGSKEIYVIDYDGARLSRISNLGSISISPAWSRDGSQIAFTTWASGNPDLVRMKIGAPDAIAVSARPGINSAPAWHPDGKRIAAALSFEGNTELYLMDLNGKALERLTGSRSST